MKMNTLIWIEGTDEAGCYGPHGKSAPWAVYDLRKGDWIAEYRWRWLAILRATIERLKG
jgi:hypothetical protein